MKVLLIKTSSMGDLIHTLPALTDASIAIKGIEFDWVTEPAFAEIPHWHPSVKETIAIPLRNLRKKPLQNLLSGEWKSHYHNLHNNKKYDVIIDAQGLVKSALLTLFVSGKTIGLDFKSAREGLASLFYQKKVTVNFHQHAVDRMRQLLSRALDYPLPNSEPDYGIDHSKLASHSYGSNCILFLHGTTWTTKHWPQTYWEQLGYLASLAGFQVLLPWGNESEKLRAQAIQAFTAQKKLALFPIILPKISLGVLTSLINDAKGIISVDTGLGHIAAAMGTPTLSLYGPTNPAFTGAKGPNQTHLTVNYPCAPCLGRNCKKGTDFAINPPCFTTLSPDVVWSKFMEIMN